MTDHAPTLAVTVLMALIYLMVVRLVDLNEKEPFWAVGMLFVLGGLGAVVMRMLFGSAVLDLSPVPSALAKELGRFLAIGAGVGVLTALAARRGWSEINGLMDGVVYGAAGGLGFATGDVFIRDLFNQLGGVMTVAGGDSLVSGYRLGSLALVGLADGIFGALMGIGFAAALYARIPLQRLLFPLVSFAAAVSAHVSYEFLAYGDALGAEGLVRKYAALMLPALIVIAVVAVALGREGKAIREQLASEHDTGIVTADELRLLRSFWAREGLYIRTLLRGKFAVWSGLKGLHNRQVQLALAKRRASLAGRDETLQQASPEVQQLRLAVVDLKRMLEASEPATASPQQRTAASSSSSSEPLAGADEGGEVGAQPPSAGSRSSGDDSAEQKGDA